VALHALVALALALHVRQEEHTVPFPKYPGPHWHDMSALAPDRQVPGVVA
jgi:hypothetical protein